ncbi:hypothetical protein DITRI_Ditri20bG0057100 [Diplodiscus trichospermus]
MPGVDANGGPCYIGTGCFHRREALCGKKYDKQCKVEWKRLNDRKVKESASVLEQTCKALASSTFEQNTLWRKEVCDALSHMRKHNVIHSQRPVDYIDKFQ